MQIIIGDPIYISARGKEQLLEATEDLSKKLNNWKVNCLSNNLLKFILVTVRHIFVVHMQTRYVFLIRLSSEFPIRKRFNDD